MSISDLCDDVLLLVISHLSGFELCQLELVSKWFQTTVRVCSQPSAALFFWLFCSRIVARFVFRRLY